MDVIKKFGNNLVKALFLLCLLTVYISECEGLDKKSNKIPQDAEAYYNKGVVLNKLGKPHEAIQAYNKAIEINPKYAKALN